MESYMLYIVTFLIGYIFYILYQALPWLKQVRRSTKALKPFLCVKPHWLFGHIGIHPGANEEGLFTNIEWIKKAPKAYAVHIGPVRPFLCLNHPDTLKQLLRTNEPKNTVGGGGYNLIMPWIGEGLLTSGGQKWFRNRKLLTPGFHFDILKPYINIYNKSVEVTMTEIDKQSQNGESVEIYNLVSLLTLDIILKCAFSYEEDVQHKGETVPYIQSVYALSNLIVKRAMMPPMYFDKLYYLTSDGKAFKKHCNSSHQIASEVIQKRKIALQNTGAEAKSGRYVDFLDILLLAKDEEGKGLTDREIRDEVETFMFEGHDTTASGVSWALYNLARHPVIQSKVYKEIDSIIGHRNPPLVQWEDLSKFEYLTMCIKESMRLHPPVVAVGRELTKPLTIDNHEIPIGTVLDIHIWNVHHNPQVWGPDVMAYDPDRFLPENIKKMDPYSFIPFSAGTRNCIGQNFAMNEMKSTISRILQKYRLTVDENHKVQMLPELILKTTNGIKLFFNKRT